MTFPEYLTELGLAERTVELYAGAARACLAQDDPLELVVSGGLSPSRRDTFRKALLHWARWQGDGDLEQRLREAVVPGTRQRAGGRARAITLPEWHALRKAAAQLSDEAEAATLVLVITSGLRVSEVLGLTREQLREALETGRATGVRVKGGGERTWPLVGDEPEAAAGALVDLLRPGEPVWFAMLSRSRQQAETVKRRLRTMLARLGRQLGIKERVHPHICRRAVGDAVRVYSNGDMKLVQEVLGHSRLQTTLDWYQDHGHPDEVRAALTKAFRGEPADE